MRSRSPAARVRALLAVCALGAASCASLEFERDTPTSGTFTSSAWALTFFSIDIPSPALVIARGNASDAGRPNTIVRRESVLPYLGPLDWILDIFMVRRASVRGTWGYPPLPEDAGAPSAEAPSEDATR